MVSACPPRRRSGPPSARQRARTDAAPCLPDPPPAGAQREAPAPLRSARATDSCHPSTPSRGLCGSLPLLKGAAGPLQPALVAALRAVLGPPKAGTSVSSSLVPRLCTVLPQGSCVKVWPSAALAAGAVATGRADTPGTHGVRGAHQQDGHRRRAASEGKRAGQAGFGNRHDACRRQGARSRLTSSSPGRGGASRSHLPGVPMPGFPTMAAVACRSSGTRAVNATVSGPVNAARKNRQGAVRVAPAARWVASPGRGARMPPTLQQPRHGLLKQPFPHKGRDGCAPMGMKNISFRERFDRQGVRSLANPRSLHQEERKCTWRVLLLEPSPPL